MLQNQDDRFNAVVAVTFAPSTAKGHYCEVSPLTGEEQPLLEGLVIQAGSACLVVLSSNNCGSDKTHIEYV